MAETSIKIRGKKQTVFKDKVKEIIPGGGNLDLCLTCGACASGCPASGLEDMDPHHHPIVVSPCGKWSVEFAECLASCGTAPVCLVNDDFHEGVSADKAKDLLNQYDKA